MYICVLLHGFVDGKLIISAKQLVVRVVTGLTT